MRYDYQLVFYTVKEGQHEENYRAFITKYDTYDEQMKDVASKLFEKYKDYKFNFEGSYRYELFEEYYKRYYYKNDSVCKLRKWYRTIKVFWRIKKYK